jgi:3-oxoacyl-[acyl-carrier-protein] synthase I
VSAAGATAAATWDAVRAGRSGIGPIRQWDPAGWPCTVAGEIPGLDPRALVKDRRLHKLLSRADLLGLKAAVEAVEEAGLAAARERLDEPGRAEFNERTAVVAASGGASYRNQWDFLPPLESAAGSRRAFGEEVPSAVTPMWLLRNLPNNVLCYAGVTLGFKGPNANFTSHSASGVLALLEASRMLHDGEADRALVVGYDTAVEPQVLLHYARLGLLAAEAIRAFDAARDGCLLGEGAGALVLETEEAAARRGARALGEVRGGAVASEGEGLLSIREDGDGVARALRSALEETGLSPRDISLVAAHGNGTERSDLSEGRAILEVFGGEGPAVTAFKWALGHLFAASGAAESVLALRAMGEGVAPGIPTLRRLDPALAGLRADPLPRALAGRTGVLIGRGFAGLDAALVFSAVEPAAARAGGPSGEAR